MLDKSGPLRQSVPMITLVISGGQTGADQAGWRAAKACGIATRGWMPKGFHTEEGPQPLFAELFGAQEMPTPSYRLRTEQNVRDSDGTIWFGRTETPGAEMTLDACKRFRKPLMLVGPGEDVLASDVVEWLRKNPQIKQLNIAGNPESKFPYIGEGVERFLIAVFNRLNERPDS